MQSHRSESETRNELIDRQLAQAGWSIQLDNLTTELYLPAPKKIALPQAPYETGDEFADYALLGRDGKPIAVLEAKRARRDAMSGRRQVSDYADRIRAHYGVEPFIFLSNGRTHWLWERDWYPPREISGFYTPEDLDRLALLRQYRQPLTALGPNPKIVDRPFQVEAVKRLTEAISGGRRKSLLVMATGTGKTRTAIAFVDLLLRARYANRVLFLVDRRELAKQARDDFKLYLPNETLTRIERGDVDRAARIHIATYPSLMQVYQRLSAGFYDLVIADESHRSMYNRYRVILEHFDALQLGLTATPTDYIEHNTFELFDCADGLPTFYYPYETAVQEGYLTNYRVLDAQTNFQLQGIKAGQLPPEIQRQLEEQGIDLGDIDFEGTDLEKRVTNTGTNDAIVHEFMANCRKDATGTLPAKTIIFAVSHHHAMELFNSFNRLYPNLQKSSPAMAEVIDSRMERAEKLLDDFKSKDMPRVAISVDMLDTGIDVPAIENLVFAKPVFSQVKFWQMIGRGTRLYTDSQTGRKKQDFLIIDHWNNFAYFNMNPQGEVAKPTEPLPVSLFRLRLEKLVVLRGLGNNQAAAAAVSQLQDMLSQLPADNPNVRVHGDELAKLAGPASWEQLDADRIHHLSNTVAPLLRLLSNVSLPIMTFEVRTERLALAVLAADGDRIDPLRRQVTEDIKSLPTSLPEVQERMIDLAQALSPGFWDHLDYDRVMDLQATFAPLMRYRQRQTQEIIQLHLPDEIARRRWIVYGPGGEGAFAESYREQVEAVVKNLAEQLPALEKLNRGVTVSDADLQEIAGALDGPDLFITEDLLREVYERPDAHLLDFLKHILGFSQLPSRDEEIRRAFDDYLAAHPHFTASQVNFLRTVRQAVLQRAKLIPADLEQPPFSRVGEVKNLFTDEELTEIISFANTLVA